jgi:hypothetical protein
MEDGAAALGAVALAVDGRPLAQDDEAPIDMLGGVTTSTNFSLEPASAVSASSAPTTSADDDEAPSELLALLLEEWPDLMELVLAQLQALRSVEGGGSGGAGGVRGVAHGGPRAGAYTPPLFSST